MQNLFRVKLPTNWWIHCRHQPYSTEFQPLLLPHKLHGNTCLCPVCLNSILQLVRTVDWSRHVQRHTVAAGLDDRLLVFNDDSAMPLPVAQCLRRAAPSPSWLSITYNCSESPNELKSLIRRKPSRSMMNTHYGRRWTDQGTSMRAYLCII